MDHRRNHRGCTVGDCLVVVNRGGAAPNFRVSMDHWRSRGGWWLAGMDGVDSAGADDFGGFVGESTILSGWTHINVNRDKVVDLPILLTSVRCKLRWSLSLDRNSHVTTEHSLILSGPYALPPSQKTLKVWSSKEHQEHHTPSLLAIEAISAPSRAVLDLFKFYFDIPRPCELDSNDFEYEYVDLDDVGSHVDDL
ncbi:hypothetical protein E3N88_43071 [Mikania micrantha]|uniref:Uncharacterized protein n=1 Tax=Mikania micrantha TaxID=192012 RepID=A0A5N6LFX8_9ASTR|nr:hypothetical protein E3N88_43071 [Mikania micrantha]